jgi:hypothetical protein
VVVVFELDDPLPQADRATAAARAAAHWMPLMRMVLSLTGSTVGTEGLRRRRDAGGVELVDPLVGSVTGRPCRRL